MENTLFTTSAANSGFRLYTFQVFNWGTFDKRVHTMRPEGQNALLTGANGSGKTTLVDALIALLVPRPERFFNQSAGAEDRQKQRSKSDYVLGKFGKSDTGGENLRELDGAWSALLGVFKNTDQQQVLTLGQLRFFQNGSLQERFFTSSQALDIETHLKFDGDFRKFSKWFKDQKYGDFHENFAEYARFFSKTFGLRVNYDDINRSKSLNLFGQSVGIKVLGNIDDFIRQHLLDEPDTEEDFRNLKNNFNDLAEALQNIEKAERQQQILAPIVQNSRLLTIVKADLFNLEQAAEWLDPWFAERKISLIEAERELQQEKLLKTQHDLNQLETSLRQLREEESDLKSQLKSSDIGREITALETEISRLESSKKQKKAKADRYADLIQSLGGKWIGEPDAALFFSQLSSAKTQKEGLRTEQDQQRGLRDEVVSQLNNQIFERKKVENELDSLEKRSNNLPANLVNARDTVAEALGIAPALLPFVGELLQVKTEERERWEPALERLLGGFARFVIVPAEHYRAVNAAVRSRDLGVLFRYYEVKPGAPPPLSKDSSPERANNKLDILPDTPHRNWLAAQLRDRFDHLCTDDAEIFATTKERAITPEGLLKDGSRNEKDDSRRGTHHFVLGWNNDGKKRELKRLRHSIQQDIEKSEGRQKALEDKLAQMEKQSETLAKLLELTNFDEIDHRSDTEDMAEKQTRLNELRQSSDHLKLLEKQLESVKEKIEKAEKTKTQSTRQEENQKTELQQLHREQLRCQDTLDRALPRDRAPLLPFVEKLGYEPDLDTIDKAKNAVAAELRQQQNDRQKEETRLAKSLVADMTAFKNSPKDPQGRDLFPRWVNDTAQLPDRPDTEHLPLYTEFHERITADELPGLRERFARMMSTDITNQMSSFVHSLNRKLDDIKEAIDAINDSMRHVRSQSFLQLQHNDNQKGRIGEFRALLSGWRYDTGEYQFAEQVRRDEMLRYTYLKIEKIIRRLDDGDWRKEVADVRNWLTFSAQEYGQDLDHPLPGKYFDSTGALSGGEKARLTYTILAAALSYQFNIQEGARSFRFLLVDEAFSKLDEDNAHFLLDLCESLHLQLIFGTPFPVAGLHVVEKKIGAIFFVQKKTDGPKPRSVLYNMSIGQFLKEKAQHLQTT